MPSVDDRVVQLRFENAQFEKGVSTSMNTLDKLDSKLKSGVSGTALLALGTAATKTAGNFSSLFKQVSQITAISKIVNSAINTSVKLATAIPNQIISGGKTRALNIEQAKFQLSGLNVLWEDIYDNIDKAVSGTAYGLDEAAKVASQLVASGVKYGDATSDMAHALRGISGVAAMTNSSYEEIGSIFTTVAGQGKLMTMQLRQLEARGLNVAAKLGEQLGKSEEKIRDMVTKGKIDFITFSNAMDEAFGEHATKANETFTGAFSNMKAALSRIGADFATPILQNTRDIFNALRLTFNAVRGITRPFAENVFTQSFGNLTSSVSKMISSISDRISNFTSSAPFKLFVDLISKDKIEMPELSFGNESKDVEKLQKILKSLGLVDWKATGYFGTKTESAIKGFQKMHGLMETGIVDLQTWSRLLNETEEDLQSTFHNNLPILFFDTESEKVSELQNLLKTLGLVSWEATGYFGPLTQEAIKSFQRTNGLVDTGVVNLETWLKLLGKTKEELSISEFFDLPDLFFGAENDKVKELQNILKDKGLVDWEATGYFGTKTEAAIKSFQVMNGLMETGIVDLQTWSRLLGKSQEDLYAEYQANLTPAERLINIFSNLKSSLLNFKAAFSNVGSAIKRAWKDVFPSSIQDVLNNLLSGIERFSEKILNASKRIKAFSATHMFQIQNAFKVLFSILSIGQQIISGLVRGVKELFGSLFSSIKPASGAILSFIGSLGKSIIKFNDFAKETDFFGNVFHKIVEWILLAKDLLGAFFTELRKRVSESSHFQALVKTWQDFTRSIQTLGSHVWERIVELWEKLNKQAEELGYTLPEIAAGGLMEGLLFVLEKIFDIAVKIIDFVTPAIGWISDNIGNLITVLDSINLSNILNGSGPIFDVSFSDVFGSPTEIVNNLLNNVFGLFSKIKTVATPVAEDVFNGVVDFVSGVDALAPAIDTVSNAVDSAVSTVESITGAIDTVKGTVKTVSGTVESVSSTVTEAINTTKDAASSAKDVVTDTILDVENVITPVTNTVRDLTGVVSRGVGSFGKMANQTRKVYAPYKDATEHAKGFIQTIDGVVTSTEGVNTVIDGVSNAMSVMGDTASTAGSVIQKTFSGIKRWVGGSIDSVKNWFSTLDSSKFMAFLTGAGAVAGIVGIIGVFRTITKLVTTAGKVVDTVVKGVGNIVDAIKAKVATVKRAQTWKILVALALIVAVVVGAIKVLSTIPTEDLWRSIGIVAGIMVFVLAMTWTLTAMSKSLAAKDVSLTGITLLVAALGLTIFAIAGAIKLLDSVELTGALFVKIGILAALVIGMTFVIKALSKSTVKDIASGIGSAIMMLAFAAAISLLIKALQKLAKADFHGIGDNLAVMLSVLGMFAILAKSMGKSGFGSALGLTLMIADIWLLVAAMNYLAKVDTSKLLASLPALITIVGMMTLMMLATRVAGKHAAGAGIGILAMSVSLLIIARAVKKLSELDTKKMWNATLAIDTILLMFGALMAASYLGKAGALLASGAAFILVSASLLLVAIAIKKLAAIDGDDLLTATVVIDSILALFAAIMTASSIAKPGKLLLSIASFVILLAAIFGMFYLLKEYNIDPNDMESQTDSILRIIEAFVEFVAFAGIIGAIPGAGKAIAKGVGVIDLVVADLAVLIGGIGAIVNLLDGESAFDTGVSVLTKIADFINKYGITFGIVVAACAGLGFLTEITGPAILIGVAAVDLVVTDLALLFEALSVFGDENGVLKLSTLETGITVAEKIGEGVGRFFGAISGAFSEAKMERQGKGVESLSASLEKSTGGLQAFTDAVNGLDTTKVNDVSSLATAVETMSTSAKTYSPELAQAFSDALTAYGNSASEFFSLMTDSGVDVSKAAKFADAIASLSTIGMYGDASTFDAEMFRSFTDAIHSYAISSLSILTIINGESFVIDESKIKAIVQMGQDLATIYDSIPATGGVVQKFFGEESLTTFAGDITRYVTAMRLVNDVITGFEPDTDAWGFFVDTAGKFSELLNGLGRIFIEGDTAADQNKMSFLTGLLGSTSLDTFAKDIANYVKGIIAVNDVLVSLTNETFYAGTGVGYLTKEKDYEWSGSWDMLVEVGQKMSELYKSLPGYLPEEDAGFFQRIANFLTRNKNGLSTFGEDLKDYILAIVKVNDEIIAAGLDPETLQIDALDAVRQVATDWTTIATDLDGVDTNKIRELGLSLGGADTGFMLGFKNFYDTITIMDMSLISSAIENMKAILISLNEMASADTTGIGNLSAVSNALGDLGTTFATAFSTGFLVNTTTFMGIGFDIVETIAEGMLENPDELTTASSSVAALGATAATDKGDLYQLAGTYLMMYMKAGMDVMGGQIYTAVYNMAGKGVSGANGKYTAYWWAGYYLARGLINGMKSQYGALYSAGAGMASKALQGVTDTAQEQSPSKLTTLYGLYMGQGLANGLTDSEGTVVAAAEGMTKSMLSSLNSVVGYVYDLLSGALDYDMTIRPVVDLSNVRAGMQELGGMFGSNQYTMGGNMYVPKIAVGKLQNEDKTVAPKTTITNNFYVQKMDEGQIDYFVNRVNSQLGARV